MASVPKTAVMIGKCPLVLDNLHIAECPKLLLPVANRRLVEYQASVMAAAGVQRVVVCLHCVLDGGRHGPDGPIPRCGEIMAEIRHFIQQFFMKVEVIFQDTQRGTGGTLKELEPLIGRNRLWFFGTDLFLSGGLDGMAKSHLESGVKATIGAVRIEEKAPDMERIEVDADSKVTTISRMHPACDRRSRLRPVGLYLFEPEVLDLIPRDRYFDIKEQLIPLLRDRSYSVKVWEIQEYCQNIITMQKYFKVNRDVLRGRAVFPALPVPVPDGCGDAHVSTLSTGATVIPPVIVGRDCAVSEDAILVGPTSIGNSCVVEGKAVLNSCLVLNDCHIGHGAMLTKCFLGEGVGTAPGRNLTGAIMVRDPTCALAAGKHHLRGRPSGGEPLPHPPDTPGRAGKTYLAFKRTMDIVLSIFALVAAAPILLIAALAIKMDSPGPVVFKQRRCGKDGEEFTMFKLRSMRADAEEYKMKVQYLNDVDGPMFKVLHDPRITRVGRFLRACNLDEVPQFYNVLRGEMTLVGPRPLSWNEMALNPQWRDTRLTVKPGLTGLWQVKSHDKSSFAEWIQYDTVYVEGRNTWLDIKVIFETLAGSVAGLFKHFRKASTASEQ